MVWVELACWQGLPAQALVNLAWEQGNGAPSQTIDYSVSAFDAWGNLIVVGNTLTSGEAENFLITKFDPEGQILWEDEYDYSSLTDFATAVATDGQGSIYVAGASTDSTEGYDYALLKLDDDGNRLWSVRYNGPGNGDDIPTALALDANGAVYVSGASLGSGSLEDFATLKYSSSGVQQWVARYDYAGWTDAVAGLVVDEIHQQVVVTGASAANTTDWDVATLRYDLSTGNALSVTRQATGASAYSDPVALTQDDQGNFYITGTIHDGSDTDIQTLKLDSTLAVQWVETYDGGLLDGGRDVIVDANGDLYVAGYRQTETGMAFQLLKYADDGSLLWQASRNGQEESDLAAAKYLSLDPQSGGVYVSGQVNESGQGSYLMTLLYGPEGELLWEHHYDDPGEEEIPTDLRADLFGAVYLTGKSQSSSSSQYLILKYEVLPVSPQPVLAPNGVASHVANEVLVRFDPGVVDPAFVDNTDLQFGRVEDIITDTALIALMDSKLDANGQLGSWTLSRVFHSLNTQSETFTSVLGREVKLPKLWSAFRLHLPVSLLESLPDEHAVADSLSTLPLRYIRYAHPSYYLHLQACAPDDPRYGNQLSLDNNDPVRTHINAEQAWCFLDSVDAQKGKPAVRVGIFDTGITASHPDFVFGGGGYAGSVVDGGQRFINGVQTGVQYAQADPQGHGSKTAGIIAAIRNNNTGIAGIAGGDVGKAEGEGAHLYDLRTFTADFFGTTATIPDLADAFMWSLTAGPGNSPLFPLAHHGYGFLLNDIQVSQPNVALFREVWETAFKAEVSSVVSRGNAIEADPNAAASIPATFSIDSIQEPSVYFDDWNLSVGASDEGGNIATWLAPSNPDPFSSYYGKSVDLIAPGVSSILETTNSQSSYSDFNGTSAAAPHVTGAAALLMSYSDVPLAPEDVEHLLQYGAVPKSIMDSTGWGLLDAYASLKLIEQPEQRIFHFDTLLTSGAVQATPGTITIRLTSDYDTIAAGIYQATPYQYVATFSYNLGSGASLAALPAGKLPYWYWVRNSGSSLWGPNGTLVGGSSQYVVPVDQVEFAGTPTPGSASLTGYYYEVFLSPTQSVVIPYGADTGARLAFSLLAYNPSGFPTDIDPTDITNGLSMEVFPNPTPGSATLRYELAQPATVRLTLLELSGRALWQDQIGPQMGGVHTQELPVKSLPAGMYLLRMQAGDQSSFLKLIKQ